MLKFVFALCFVPLLALAQVPAALQEGDIIFHKSQSGQGPALRILTESEWTHTGIILGERGRYYVMEASSTVKLTPLQEFINRGNRGHYIIRRLDPRYGTMDAAAKLRLRAALEPMLGKQYDIWFQWSDSTIYCSELVWKAYQRALNVEVGQVQRFREFPLDHPAAREMIRRRYTEQGRELNVDEKIVTPVAVLESDKLVDVVRVVR